ncbi:MAG: glutamyl-tRNA reductase [Sandaracinaceae bacterium]|nr:glutamyl-tRNA reductase [Sandaracinaceae bacterium]
MTDVFVVGISHKTSPVELREKLAVEERAVGETARALTERAGLREAVLLSTCNRVEVYAGEGDEREVARWLEERAGGPIDAHVYVLKGSEAVQHAFRVAASLDSMVVGEPQILGQFKEAYTAAKEAGAIGSLLDRCFTKAFAVAKRVRSETKIAEGSVSVSSVASDLARKIFEDLDRRRVLLIGAGEMGEQAAKHLRQAGASLYVVNRSLEKAQKLAEETGGIARSIEALAAELTEADVAIASTSSQRFVITTELMRGVIKARRHRPLFLIDIAVPRDVDPRVGEMDNVFLYDVDDLSQVAEENLGERRRAAVSAEQIVRAEVEEFEAWRRSGALKPTIVGLRRKVRGVLASELERTLPRLNGIGEAERRSLDKMLDAMTNKLVHRAIAELKASTGTADGHALVETTRRLFDLEPGDEDEGAASGDAAANRSPTVLEPATRGKAS